MISPEQFTEALKKSAGENLRSVVLYGSAVSGEYIKNISDYNILAIMRKMDLENMRKTTKIIRKWVKEGNPPPMMFTLERFQSSVDVFPMVISDLKENHKILYGDDPLTEIDVHMENFRLELERELKSKLIQLREASILAEGKSLKDLLMRSYSTFCTFFRHTLRLLDVKPLPSKREAPEALSKYIAIDLGVCRQIQALREGQKIKVDLDDILSRYLKSIEEVVDAVDRYVHGKPLQKPEEVSIA